MGYSLGFGVGRREVGADAPLISPCAPAADTIGSIPTTCPRPRLHVTRLLHPHDPETRKRGPFPSGQWVPGGSGADNR